MTVDVFSPFVSDFLGDKSFGLDDLEFTTNELETMASSFGPSLVPSVDPVWTFPPLQQQQPMYAEASSTPVGEPAGFVQLQQLQKVGSSPVSAQSQQVLATASPASSGSQQGMPQQSGATSNYSPSGDASSDSYAPGSEVTKQVKKDPRIGKRKPDVDLSTITDIAERRKQRRLAKNRATAATSRERKRKQMAEMTTRVSKLEADNAALTRLLAQRDSEVATLKSALDTSAKGLHPSLISPVVF